jgi:hypothetical protein
VYQALPYESHVPCPNCGHDALRVAFVGDQGESDGYAFFWCDNCLLGLPFSRVPIPEGVELLPRSMGPEELAEKVPKFTFVLPEAGPKV